MSNFLVDPVVRIACRYCNYKVLYMYFRAAEISIVNLWLTPALFLALAHNIEGNLDLQLLYPPPLPAQAQNNFESFRREEYNPKNQEFVIEK
jgi:hypothetical protein